MKLWRIAAETRRFKADDLGGGGAAVHPGRWNEEGEPVVYTATSIALAFLETAAYVDDRHLPLNRFLVRIDVPPRIWARRLEWAPVDLPPAWSAVPAGAASVDAGSRWLASKRSCLVMVPSVLVPEERNVLINPKHPDARQLRASVVRPFGYSGMFRR